MKQVFSSSHLNVFIHSGQHGTVELQWLDFANSEQLRENILQGLAAARQYGVKAWLADNTLLRAIRPKDFEWMGPNIIQPLDALDVKRIAVVDSNDPMNRLGVKTFLASTIPGTGISTSTFATVEAARAWTTGPL